MKIELSDIEKAAGTETAEEILKYVTTKELNEKMYKSNMIASMEFDELYIVRTNGCTYRVPAMREDGELLAPVDVIRQVAKIAYNTWCECERILKGGSRE